MGPLLLKSFYLSPIWGGSRIAEARGIPWTPEDRHGESFDVSAHPTTMGIVLNGPLAGMTLAEATGARGREILGDVPDDAPVQVTFMDAAETLSVQVHPGESYAREAEGDHGKVESWYIVHAEPGATLIAGCTTDDLEALRAAAADDTIGERYGRRVEVHAGDFVLIPPGTMHALGAGIFAVEVASLGNTTYRLCDWGRGRELHVEKAFDVLDVTKGPSVVRLGPPGGAAGDQERVGADAGFFKSYVVDVVDRMSFCCNGRYAVLTCVDGVAKVGTPDGDVTLGHTQSCLVPAAAQSYTIAGPCRVLRSVRTPAQP
ncbi:MAG: class I mannose-6-phosphate isomerase [Acidobacteriota bacterium]|nr:class I mannose-6-phosphate isomerase [Acidobacteriota bacterium]